MSSLAVVLIPLAAAMAVALAGLIRWSAHARSRTDAAWVGFLLAGMASMLGGGAILAYRNDTEGWLAALWLGGLLMALSATPLLWTLLGEARRRSEDPRTFAPAALRDRRAFVGIVVALVLGNELLMGWLFPIAAGGGALVVRPSLAGTVTALGVVVGSPWFLFPMAAEMGLTTVWLWTELDPALRVMLAFQSAMMVLSPPALPSAAWHASTIYLSSALMIGLFVYQMEWVYRHPRVGIALGRYTIRLLAVYALLMAGLYEWLATGSVALFAVAVLAEMVLFFSAVADAARFRDDDPFTWQLRPSWAVQLLGWVLVAELFMGALLDLEANGNGFLLLVPQLPLSGDAATIAAHAVSNGFWFVAVVTGSAGFLVMMGSEMGVLVALKIRETRRREQRLRLGLTIAAFAATTVYFPGFWNTVPISHLPPIGQVPVLGWTMGIGSGGGLAPGFFVAILVTYLLIGSMSALFGRRVLCSVLCSAATMYQGTLVDSMKSFNRSSPVGRKFLGTHFSSAYTVTTGVTLGSLAGASTISYLDAIGRLQWTVGGSDPTQFLFSFYFGVLWYVMFVTIPYTGNYNCVTMGWCHWGTWSQAFSRLGFFRLKVKDRTICQQCRTLDCAKSCPIGLVDMVGQLRTTGEFRSSKCCGVGNCVGACPYGNLYIHDVRHWWRGRRPAFSGTSADGVPLPMVRGSRPLTVRNATADVPRTSPGFTRSGGPSS